MKRMQIRLDEGTFETLRRRALEKGCSISSLVRELLAQSLATGMRKQRTSIKDFAFVGAGRCRQGRLSPVSERHDEALAVRIPKRKQESQLLRPKKKSWAALGESLHKFTDDFMKDGRNQPRLQKRGRVFS